MNLLKELLTLREDSEYEDTPIPPRISRLMRDEDIKYPGADTLEKLKVAHAKQLLSRDGGEDSAERALSYALGMNGKSKAELQAMIDSVEGNQSDWGFTANDPGFSGLDSLTGPEEAAPDGSTWHLHIIYEPAHDGQPDIWECGAVDDDYQPVFDNGMTITVENRHEIEEWIRKHGFPMPTEADFKKIGL